jgi:RNA polymerase sigma-70 factor (ECF subfamily)
MSAVGTTVGPSDFEALTEPFRRELLAHCYRMLGSMVDAEDLVQETYIRAWRGFDGFEGRSSLRVWLYKIATMACLTALGQRARRPLPSGLVAGSTELTSDLTVASDVDWLQPAPDARLLGRASDPAELVVQRDSVRLAFVAALQHLSPRQRAVLILREVLGMRANEVADILDSTSDAVHSTLRRARSHLSTSVPREHELRDPESQQEREILDRYVDAFQRGDIDGLTDLLRAEVALEMPPFATWFQGREAVLGFLAERVFAVHDGWCMRPTRANGQPAALAWVRDEAGELHPHGVQVLDVERDGISRIVSFNDPGLLALF